MGKINIKIKQVTISFHPNKHDDLHQLLKIHFIFYCIPSILQCDCVEWWKISWNLLQKLFELINHAWYFFTSRHIIWNWYMKKTRIPQESDSGLLTAQSRAHPIKNHACDAAWAAILYPYRPMVVAYTLKMNCASPTRLRAHLPQ